MGEVIHVSTEDVLDTITFSLSGVFIAGTDKDGSRVATRDGEIVAVVVSQSQRGNNGDNLYDIHKHTPTLPITTQRNDTIGVTIYTTQANRPKIEGLSGSATDNAIFQAPLPDIVDFLAGEFFTMDVDNVTPQSQDVVVQLLVKYK